GEHVKQRPGANKQSLSYLEAWQLIETANRIFGFAGWSRETVATECLHEPRLITDPSSPEANKVVAAYSAKLRVTVFAGDHAIVREGCGAARGFAKTVGEALELALKSAETDGMKRALATFGNQFGLCLYDKEQKGVAPRGNGRRQLPEAGERAIDSGFEPQKRPTISQRAIAARNGKRDDLPV